MVHRYNPDTGEYDVKMDDAFFDELIAVDERVEGSLERWTENWAETSQNIINDPDFEEKQPDIREEMQYQLYIYEQVTELMGEMEDPDGDDIYTLVVTIPTAGNYECKVTLNHNWDQSTGGNTPFTTDGVNPTTFTYDFPNNITMENVIRIAFFIPLMIIFYLLIPLFNFVLSGSATGFVVLSLLILAFILREVIRFIDPDFHLFGKNSYYDGYSRSKGKD